MIPAYLRQKAAPWVSALVLACGLAIALLLVFLQRVTVQASNDLAVQTDIANYNWTPPNTATKKR